MAILQQLQDYRIPVADPTTSIINMRGAAIKQRGQQIQNEMGQAKLDRYGQESNLLNAVSQAQGLLNLPQGTSHEATDQIQNQFLQGEVTRMQSEGGDISGLMKVMSLTPEQRIQSAQGVIEMGQSRGLIQPEAKVAQQKNMIVKRVNVGGVDRFVGFDPITGAEVQDLGLAGKTGGMTVNVGGKKFQDAAEKKFAEESGKTAVGSINKMTEETRALQEVETQLMTMKNTEIDSGKLAPFKMGAAQWATALGFPEIAAKIGNAPSLEVWDAATTDLLNKTLNMAKGPQTDFDAARARRTLATMSDTNVGRKFKMNLGLALNRRQQEQNNFISSEITRGRGKVNESQARTQWFRSPQGKRAMVGKTLRKSGVPWLYTDWSDLTYRRFEKAGEERPSERVMTSEWEKFNGK